MNDYNNMNYFIPNMPNDFSYLNGMNGMQNVNNWGQNTGIMNQNKPTINPNNNLNFNKCDFNGKTMPNQLYDVYNGFIRGNMFPNLYNQYKISRPFEIEPLNEQAELLTYIDAYSFGAHDINLYLDTHPNDSAMLDLFKQYTNEKEKLINQYEKKYGPLFVSGATTNPWSWNNDPWPWENK